MEPVGSIVEERFACAAEDCAVQWKISPAYDDIGEKLMALRKEAWDRYSLRALWNVRPDATLGAMRSVANALRCYGDMDAAFLAGAILREVDRREEGRGASR